MRTPGPWYSYTLNGTCYVRESKGGTVADFIKVPDDADAIAGLPALIEAARSLVIHLRSIEGGRWLENKPGSDLESALRACGEEVN